MKKLLVCTDFTEPSRNACLYAASLAKVFNAAIYLLHVHREWIPASVGPEPWSITLSEQYQEKEKHLNQEINFLKEKYPVQIRGEVKPGFRSDSISETAREIEADLIVMGISHAKKKPLGSTTLKVMRKAHVPVLVVPESASFHSIKNIVLAVDFKEMLTSSCFTPLLDVVKKFDASLRVLHVDKKGAELKVSEVPEKLQLGLVLAKFTYEYDRIESDDVDQGIEGFVDAHPADLLVMVAHPHGLFERLFSHLHTQVIGMEIKLPLLVLKTP